MEQTLGRDGAGNQPTATSQSTTPHERRGPGVRGDSSSFDRKGGYLHEEVDQEAAQRLTGALDHLQLFS